MKKFAWALMTAFVSLAVVFTGCKSDAPSDPSDPSDPSQPSDPSDPSDPEPEPEPEIEFPELTAEDGTAVVAIYVPEGVDCNGIVFKGTNDAWTTVPEIPFEKVEGTDRWYAVELELAASAMIDADTEYFYFGKACLLPEVDGVVDGSWTTQWKEGMIELNADNGNPDMFIIGCGGEGNKLGVYGSGVAYIIVEQFQANPCVANDTYSFSFKLPALCVEEDVPGLIGSFPASSWGTDIELEFDEASGIWSAEGIEGQATSEWKIRLNGATSGWNYGQLAVRNAETGEYAAPGNFTFGEELEQSFDFSTEDYAWTPCAPVGE